MLEKILELYEPFGSLINMEPWSFEAVAPGLGIKGLIRLERISKVKKIITDALDVDLTTRLNSMKYIFPSQDLEDKTEAEIQESLKFFAENEYEESSFLWNIEKVISKKTENWERYILRWPFPTEQEYAKCRKECCVDKIDVYRDKILIELVRESYRNKKKLHKEAKAMYDKLIQILK